MIDRDFSTLFQVLASEQQILQRTDQKAFTLMSILGVFMVFFIVHFTKMQLDWFKFVLVIIYFISALISIINLILVIAPRIRDEKSDSSENVELNLMFFGGISRYKTPQEYAEHLLDISSDQEKVYEMFASQVFSLGNINAYKNRALRRAIFFFVAAIISELLIIMSMAWVMSFSYLIS